MPPSKDVNDADFPQKGFAPRYFSLGVAIDGITGIPNWVQSFSIVRSKPANRVSAQGIGFYRLASGVPRSPLFNESLATKDGAKMLFHSPDMECGGVESTVIDDIISNLSCYKAHREAPIGFVFE